MKRTLGSMDFEEFVLIIQAAFAVKTEKIVEKVSVF